MKCGEAKTLIHELLELSQSASFPKFESMAKQSLGRVKRQWLEMKDGWGMKCTAWFGKMLKY